MIKLNGFRQKKTEKNWSKMSVSQVANEFSMNLDSLTLSKLLCWKKLHSGEKRWSTNSTKTWIHWKPFNMIILGQRGTNNFNWMITISKSPNHLLYWDTWNMVNTSQFDDINKMITYAWSHEAAFIDHGMAKS